MAARRRGRSSPIATPRSSPRRSAPSRRSATARTLLVGMAIGQPPALLEAIAARMRSGDLHTLRLYYKLAMDAAREDAAGRRSAPARRRAHLLRRRPRSRDHPPADRLGPQAGELRPLPLQPAAARRDGGGEAGHLHRDGVADGSQRPLLAGHQQRLRVDRGALRRAPRGRGEPQHAARLRAVAAPSRARSTRSSRATCRCSPPTRFRRARPAARSARWSRRWCRTARRSSSASARCPRQSRRRWRGTRTSASTRSSSRRRWCR